MIKLYDHPLSGNSYKSRLAFSHLGVEYEKINVDIFNGEQNDPEFVKLNPNKKIPVLVDGDFVMWESNALLLYIGKKFSPNRLFSEDAETFGLISQWLLFGKTNIDPNLAMARYLVKFVSEYDENKLNGFQKSGKAALKILDDHLSENDFLAGDYSIADIACYPYVYMAEEGNVSLSPYQNVQAWCKRIRSQPGYISMEE